MASLLLFRNDDVHLEEPYRISVPADMDTLTELCSYISAALPPPSDPSGKGYRFLYSIHGKPLWRVKDCLDAGTVVISTGPGFLARRTVAISGDATAATDVTPAGAMRRGSGGPEMERSGRVSQSPPAQQPANGTFSYPHPQVPEHPPLTALGGMSGGSKSDRMSIRMSASPFAGVADSDPAATYRVSIGGHGVPWMSASGAPVGAVPEGQSARDDGATNRAGPKGDDDDDAGPAERRGSGEGPTPPAADERLEAKRLFTPEGGSQEYSGRPSFGPPPTDLRGAHGQAKTPSGGGGDRQPAVSYDRPIYGGSHTRGSSGGRAARAEVRVDGVMRPLPPVPPFVSRAALLDEGDYAEEGNLLTGLRTYAARKWRGFSGLSAIPPSDVLGDDVVCLQVEEQLASLQWPLRVIVSGPPKSGVSTTAALALRAAIRNCSAQGPLANHLLLVLDSELLFGGDVPGTGSATAGGGAGGGSALSTPLLDASFAFQLVVRAVLDAVSVQRPALRAKGLLIAQLWDKLVTVNTASPPDFTAFAQVTGAVGHKVVAQWDSFARTAFPILQAARRQSASSSATRDGAALRDAALDIIFYALPQIMASSLRFSGIVYALDGLHILVNSHRRRLERPVGDLGPILKVLWRDENCHVIVAWPSSVPLQSIYLTPPPSASARTLQIRTVGLITTPSASSFTPSQYRGPPLPQLVECHGRQYGADVFLGCPGFLAPVAALARPLVGRPPPTASFSAYSQHRRREKASEPFTLRIDDTEVGKLLHQLEQLVAVAK